VWSTQKPEGMLYEVLRDDTGQVAWSKFVPRGRWKRHKMNLRKKPVNRSASHDSPSMEDSKGNSKKRPQWLEQEASHGRRGNSALVVFLGT